MAVQRKFPEKIKVIKEFMNELLFELSNTLNNKNKNLFEIRDMKDYPILYSAINDNVDIFIAGDKDFFDFVIIEKPEILTPKRLLKKYCKL